MEKVKSFCTRWCLAVLILLVVFSCSDNNQDGLYPEPAGFSLMIDGLEFVRYENGSYTYNPAGLTPDFVSGERVMLSMTHEGGNIYAPRYYTNDILIRFYDAKGDAIPFPEERLSDDYEDINPEGEYRLEWDWLDPVANRPANIENHSDMGSWLFHFRADKPGETGIIFKLYRCEGERGLVKKGDRTDPNHPETVARECSVDEEKVFEASTPLRLLVDNYEGIREDGRYPYERHFRIR
ncbi:hypothetical protein QLX67_09555 [Balneolaceae bacterium ANBcel3]|nr:hypothetical protein [Balneolaceae bacterium ANBcel3]